MIKTSDTDRVEARTRRARMDANPNKSSAVKAMTTCQSSISNTMVQG